MQSNNRERHSPTPLYRWTVLVFVSLAMFGNYYVYDSISPLADLLARELNFLDRDIGMLNAIYSIPNVFMVLIGGIIIDRLGPRLASFIFSALCMIGAVLTAVQPDLWVMASGRLIFGLGAESLIVAVTTIIARWFKGKELSFAFGLNLTISRLGTFAALNSPTWAKPAYENWQGPLIISVIFAVVSVISVVFYMMLDVRAEKRFTMQSFDDQDKIDLKQIFNFNRSFWLITLLCITFYSAIFPFQTFAVKFFIQHHGVTREFGGFLTSLLIFFSMVFTPMFGLLADKIGKRSLLMMIGSMMLIPVYLMMVYTDIHLLVPMAIMGISFSLIPAVMWPSVALVVEEKRLGTAYGLMTMIQNVGLAGFNLLIGWANDFSQGYTLGMWIFSILGFAGLLFAYLLKRVEQGPKGHGLEKSMGSR
ncbi:MAG: MFS transporter [Caldithrix sp.]|nr:MFS transporter [Caldithrix sp.]